MIFPCDNTFSLGTIIFYPVTLTLELDPFFEKFNLANNLWTVNGRALIFHMSIPCVKTFSMYQQFLPCDLDLGVWPYFLTLTFNFNVWTVGARALIFHMSILRDKTFHRVPSILTLWPWSLTYFFKNVKLANNLNSEI